MPPGVSPVLDMCHHQLFTGKWLMWRDWPVIFSLTWGTGVVGPCPSVFCLPILSLFVESDPSSALTIFMQPDVVSTFSWFSFACCYPSLWLLGAASALCLQMGPFCALSWCESFKSIFNWRPSLDKCLKNIHLNSVFSEFNIVFDLWEIAF